MLNKMFYFKFCFVLFCFVLFCFAIYKLSEFFLGRIWDRIGYFAF